MNAILPLFASLLFCSALLNAQTPQPAPPTSVQPVAIIIASSNLRWTVPTVVSSLRPEALLEIAERHPASGNLHALQRATESRNLCRVDPYVQLPPSELKTFCNDEVLRHLNLATMRLAQPPKPGSVAVVVLIDSKENVYYKHLSSDQLMMLQNS